MACTSPLTSGFQGVTAPVSASSSAIPSRGCPLTPVKLPPAYTLDPLTAKAYTAPLAPGFHADTARSDVTCAMLDLETPPTTVKYPPMYHPPAPSETTVETPPNTFGNPGRGMPVAASRGTPAPVAGPT